MKMNLTRSTSFKILVLTALLLFSGCEHVETGNPFLCRVGVNYRVAGDLSFSIENVYDSRCPVNAMCIWAGNVGLQFSIEYNSAHTDTLIYDSYSDNNPFILGKYTFTIQEVSPYPSTDREMTLKDYRIKMLITEN
jgi:hypothetical protein